MRRMRLANHVRRVALGLENGRLSIVEEPNAVREWIDPSAGVASYP